MTIPVTANAVGDIIALVQLGLGAVQRLNNARGAKAEYREIQSRLESLESLLELCEASVNSISDPDHKSTVMVHIDHARSKLNTALQLLPGFKRLATGTVASPVSTLRSIRSRIRDASKSVSWELRQSANARECLVKLSESTQTIHLAITAANGANANTQLQAMSTTITNSASMTLTMQSDISVTRSLVESMDARFSSVHDVLSSHRSGHSEATTVTSEIQASLRETIVNEIAGLRGDLSAHADQARHHEGATAAAAGIAQQLSEIQRAVASLRHLHRRSATSENGSASHLLTSLHSSRVTISTTTLIRISQAVVPSNELVSGGCIGSFLALAASASRSTDQAAYLSCACILFIATRMHRMYQSPVVVHVVIIVDLFGDAIQLPLHEANSAELVHVALRRHFQLGRLGFNLTQSRMYDLSISDDDGALGNLLPGSWTDLLQPGQRLLMNARIQDIVNGVELACPACHTPSPRHEEPTGRGRWVKCSWCPARFECSSRETTEDFLSVGPDISCPPTGYSPQVIHDTEIEVPEPPSRTTIERELALCKRIRVLNSNISRSDKEHRDAQIDRLKAEIHKPSNFDNMAFRLPPPPSTSGQQNSNNSFAQPALPEICFSGPHAYYSYSADSPPEETPRFPRDLDLYYMPIMDSWTLSAVGDADSLDAFPPLFNDVLADPATLTKKSTATESIPVDLDYYYY